MDIRYITSPYGTCEELTEENLEDLFSSVGWGSALEKTEKLMAITASSHLVTAWDGDRLIGLIRSMDDGVWSANIDACMVNPAYQGKGIAKHMLKDLLDMLKNVQFISVSPNEKENIGLYIKAGFKIVEDGSLLQIDNTDR